MFGESESESPRVGSPWDSLVSSSSSGPATPLTQPGGSEVDLRRIYSVSLPKLAPEADAGNIEYKLQLIDPTPERFLRLVTQLKWRLLEGGGQAYYELGVADSGQLVGLTRANLDRSLETLEMMAGEIGASVVVVKEIEVPSSMFQSVNGVGRVNNGLGRLRRSSEKSQQRKMWSPPSNTKSRVFRSRPSEWGAVEILYPDPSDNMGESDYTNIEESTHDEEEDSELIAHSSDAQQGSITSLLDSSHPSFVHDDGAFLFDLEVSSVFKPVQTNARPYPHSLTDTRFTVPHTPANKKKAKQKITKEEQEQVSAAAKASVRRARRDANRQRHQPTKDERGFQPLPNPPEPELHPNYAILPDSQERLANHRLEEGGFQLSHTFLVESDSEVEPPEPRLIVEALVVRKLSTEEAFLDFGGFSLAD